jgi:ABC-type polysaccharide/polyol phosphate transport system ATPase subunit
MQYLYCRRRRHQTDPLVLASHSDAAVSQLCTKGLLLESGRLAFFGLDQALARYRNGAI